MKKILLAAVFIVITAMSCTPCAETETVVTDSIPTVVVDSAKVDSAKVVAVEASTGATGVTK